MKVKIYRHNKIKVLIKASKRLRVIDGEMYLVPKDSTHVDNFTNIIFELDNKGYYRDLYYYDNGVLEALTSDIDNDDEELEV